MDLGEACCEEVARDKVYTKELFASGGGYHGCGNVDAH